MAGRDIRIQAIDELLAEAREASDTQRVDELERLRARILRLPDVDGNGVPDARASSAP